MRNRYRWFLGTVLGLFVLAGVAYWINNQAAYRKMVETALNNKYNLAFYNLANNIQNVEVVLSKALVGQGALQDTRMFMQIWQESLSAQANLGQIPVPVENVARTTKFINQVGAYAQTLAVQSAAGKPKTEEQWQTLQKLYKQAGQLNEEMRRVGDSIVSGRLVMNELRGKNNRALNKAGQQLENNDFQEMDKTMQQFPTLIYDGPFSDHIETREARGLSGDQTDAETAKNKALTFIEKRPDMTYTANVAGTDKGRIPVHRVEVIPNPAPGGETITLGISLQAGQPVWMVNSRSIGEAKVTLDNALETAARFLDERGFKGMESTYYETRSNTAIYNFAATQGGIILYPDLIKVSIALDNGRVVGFDASNYWMNHRQRELAAPALTVETARNKLSLKLTDVSPGRLALIPKTVDLEVLTYEFQGKMDQDTFLIYINALTGEEERVLRVIRTNEGVLTL